jgi:crossover junction endodeoxyribonuclease RuvC
MRILGIDPGSLIAGFACIERRDLRTVNPRDFSIVTAGVVRTEAKEPLWRRLGQIHLAVGELVRELEPQICVIEKAFYGANVSTAIKLGEVRGAVIAGAYASGLQIAEVTPAEVKKTIAGNGRASKEQVALAIEALMKFKRGVLPFDATDALAIALYHGLVERPH